MTESIRQWQAAGQYLNVDEVDIYYQRLGDPTAPTLVCFHGFPTSSWDWHLVLPELAKHFDLLIFDFPGYGLSGKPVNRDYSLLRQMDATEGLLQKLDIQKFDLLTHDMGNSVACELLFRIQNQLTRLEIAHWSMLNGGVYMDLHHPLFTQRLLRTPVLGALTSRFASFRVFNSQFPKTYAYPQQFSQEHFQTHWELMQHNHGCRVMHKVAIYMRERLRFNARWLGSLHCSEVEIQLIWGLQDPVAVTAIADRLMQNLTNASITRLTDCGHYPQIEKPDSVFQAVKNFHV